MIVDLPDDIARHSDPGREALEAVAIEGYRSGALTHHQAAPLLGLSRFEFDDFLIARKIHDHAYSLEDLHRDLKDLECVRTGAPSPRDPGRRGYDAASLPCRD